jgi:hypothetical protein
MAKSDLLKEAIADANAVRETALANAKIALEEAFTPRIQSMLSAKLSEELEDEEEEGIEGAMRGDEMREQEDEMDMEEPEMGDEGDVLNVSIDDPSTSENPDYVGDIPAAGEEEMGEPEMGEDDMEDDLDLESIIRELEEDLNEEEDMEGEEGAKRAMKEEEAEAMEDDIDSIIEAILGEEDKSPEELEEKAPAEDGTGQDLVEEKEAELEEAYSTIKQLQSVLQEVNLLNAKLLYTNKLFRNFELSENQKMKVIENFDRAGNTREVKLVFSTLAESFNKPAKKRVVKEHKNIASKVAGSTAPAKEIISEGNEMANRFKKLAGLL